MRKLAVPALFFLICIPIILSIGCSSAQKITPHMGFGKLDLETALDRDDIVVLDTVEGDSSITNILFGLVRIIDGSKYQILGIKFFKDKYTYFQEYRSGTWWLDMLLPVSAYDRAYYKALEAHPEADAVFFKSMDNETEGFPLIYSTREVRFHGKAIKLKADK